MLQSRAMNPLSTLTFHAVVRGSIAWYLTRERWLAAGTAMHRHPLSIAFTAREAWEPRLRRGFRGLPHRLSFIDLQEADLDPYDLIVPLSLDDAAQLRRRGRSVRARMLPLPNEACVMLCHDKPRLNRFLIDAGFADHVPRMGSDIPPPYIRKPARGEDSRHCVLVLDDAAEQALPAAPSGETVFRQAAVPGCIEYATHFLMRDRRLVREATVRYHHAQPFFIKNAPDHPLLGESVGRCPDRTVLEAMLDTIGYQGLGCANFKVDLAGRLQLIEINPRMGGSLCDYFFSFLRSLPELEARRATVRRRAAFNSRLPASTLAAAPTSAF